ncbi:MAG TPA: helicase C-terminal domain-containing protein [Candidatus Dormibacteraeota bacterium]
MPGPEYIALDLETTGLDSERDRVIEVGAVAFRVDEVLGTLERLADPGRSVPETVLRLTGIDPAELRGATPSDSALEELMEFAAGRQLVGHGADLDVAFLRGSGLWEEGRQLLDTLHLARILLPQSSSHSLPALATELGLDQPRPHRALDDADATRQLLLRLRKEAALLPESLKESMLALVAPYPWADAAFFADALAVSAPSKAQASRPAVTRPATNGRSGPDAFDPASLAALLDTEGPIAQALPEYELRESQIQMLTAVAQVIQRGGVLAVEAGTGTGTSLAYLIPLLARALAKGERAVVSTYTHTLQEQLLHKDVPAIREWLPWSFNAVVLKGRPNYVSLRRWRRYLAAPCADAAELRFKLKVLVWLHGTDTGDRSELRLQGGEEVLWAHIASDPLDCVGVHCTSEDCFVHRARAEAEAADLVIVNHALLVADAATEGGILPPFDHLVVDEAHHLEDAATQGLRREAEGAGVLALLERLAPADPAHDGLIAAIVKQPRLGSADKALEAARPAARRAHERCAELFGAVDEWLRQVMDPLRRDESVRLVPGLRETSAWAGLQPPAQNATTALAALDVQLRQAVAAAREWLGGDDPDQDLRELEIIRGRLAEAETLLREAFLEPSSEQVYWLTLLARTSSVVLRAAPINVGGLLREHVFGERSSVVFTSASLAVAGSFDYFKSRVGLPDEIETMLLPSPFDYLNQALVCLPSGLPEPQDPDFDEMLARVLADVAGGIGGRTLALFTSNRQLRETYYALKQRHDLDDVLILAQGIDGQRRQVLAMFTESERAILLGTASFWEGIDIPGDRLSCVVMARLPFPVPTEPVFAARSEQVRDPFRDYALPLAALRLKQGFGRLIRRATDRGAVVILDPRISTRDYGKAFLEVLPVTTVYHGEAQGVAKAVAGWVGETTRALST